MTFSEKEGLDLSIVMPCYNEENTVGLCIDEAKEFIARRKLKAEIIVVDNDSEDNSAYVAKAHGAKVIFEGCRGYGAALRKGISVSVGRVIIFGDSDTTYDFQNIDDFYDLLEERKFDVIIGNRMEGNIQSGAMPLTHRIGAEILSALGRVLYGVNVRDFHCGLRGIRQDVVQRLTFKTDGMEFATEMIAEAARKELNIGELPVDLRTCLYDRHSKLRTIRDGFRHWGFMVLSKFFACRGI